MAKDLPSLPAFERRDSPSPHKSGKSGAKKLQNQQRSNKPMDAFAYCSDFEKENYDEYRKKYHLKTEDDTGGLRDKYDVEFDRKEVKDAIHSITQVLKSKGLETPYLILPFRPNQSEGKLRDFLNSIFKDGHPIDAEDISDLAVRQDEVTLMNALKFFWCRLPGNAVIGWKTYTRFVQMEEESGYPDRAFLELMPSCLCSGTHASIAYDFFDLMVAMIMKSKANMLTARKLARVCGLWAFHPTRTSKSGVPSFERGLYEWIPAGDAVFHLLLSFLKAMPPKGQVDRLPRMLQQVLKSNSYPPTPTSTSSGNKFMQEVPSVTLRVNKPSKNPAELLSRVSKTLSFDDATLFYTREDFLLLKRLFKRGNALDENLSAEGARILDNVCLFDEDCVSKSPVRYKLVSGWSQDMTSMNKPHSKMPDYFTADVSRTSIDDYFIWAWMASLGNEETSVKKKMFGKTYIMEAQLAEGFKKWIIIEEQDLARDSYDMEIELKQEKLKHLEAQIQKAQEKNYMIKESAALPELADVTNKTATAPALPEKDYKKNDSLPPTPLPKDISGSNAPRTLDPQQSRDPNAQAFSTPQQLRSRSPSPRQPPQQSPQQSPRQSPQHSPRNSAQYPDAQYTPQQSPRYYQQSPQQATYLSNSQWQSPPRAHQAPQAQQAQQRWPVSPQQPQRQPQSLQQSPVVPVGPSRLMSPDRQSKATMTSFYSAQSSPFSSPDSRSGRGRSRERTQDPSPLGVADVSAKSVDPSASPSPKKDNRKSNIMDDIENLESELKDLLDDSADQDQKQAPAQEPAQEPAAEPNATVPVLPVIDGIDEIASEPVPQSQQRSSPRGVQQSPPYPAQQSSPYNGQRHGYSPSMTPSQQSQMSLSPSQISQTGYRMMPSAGHDQQQQQQPQQLLQPQQYGMSPAARFRSPSPRRSHAGSTTASNVSYVSARSSSPARSYGGSPGPRPGLYPPEQYPPQQYPPQQYSPQQYPMQQYPPQQYPPQGYRGPPGPGYPPQGYYGSPPPANAGYSQNMMTGIPSARGMNKLHGVRNGNKKQTRSALMNGDFGI